MPTNLTNVTVAVDATYTLPTPISYANLDLIDGVAHKDQLVVLRLDIEQLQLSGLISSYDELRDLMLVPSSLFTFNEMNREITAAQPVDNYTWTLNDGSQYARAVWSSGENLLIVRKNILEEPLVTWVTGSRFTADQLNLNTAQLIALIQELNYEVDRTIKRDDFDAVVNPMTKSLDAGGFGILNLPTPTSGTDAATKQYIDNLIATQLTNKLGQPNGIATLDATGKLTVTQSPAPLGTLPGSFFASSTSPTRSTGANGLFKWGSLWWNSTNGRLYVYTPDNNFGSNDETFDGEIGYWVDVASPAV
jgi:hypothetical protein